MLQGNVEQAVEVFYQCLLLGWKEGRTDLLAASTIDVSKSGPQYIQMLADVNARLTRDGYGQAVAHVGFLFCTLSTSSFLQPVASLYT